MSSDSIVAAVADVLERLLLQGQIMQPRALILAATAAVPEASIDHVKAALPLVKARRDRLLAAMRQSRTTIH